MTATRDEAPLLEVQGISKHFGATKALQDVSFNLRGGEVHALMGENGAGKSTLMNILSGTLPKDAGKILINGEEVDIASPAEARERGIAIIHQELSNVPDMTIAENLALGQEPKGKLGALDRKAMNKSARAKLQAVGLDIDPRTKMRSLTIGMQQLTEIARAVSENAKVLILDEPTSALSVPESERLFTIIDEMRARGVGLVYISHRMEEVWKLSDRITVFRDGKSIGTKETGEIVPSDVVQMMVGRPLTDLYDHREREAREVLLRTEELEGNGIGPVSICVRRGEVVCMVGLIGAGRTELARLIMGADRPSSGEIWIDGKQMRPRSPSQAIRAGIGMLPEDRKGQGLFIDHSVLDNTAVSSLQSHSRGGVLQKRQIRRSVQNLTDKMRLKTQSLRSRVSSLSGGNQQKVVFARWLMKDSDLLIMDEPTRGVDIGAKKEIYELIDDLAASGKGILMISSELPEALGVSDRLIVMHEGKVVKEMPAKGATEAQVMAYATGTAQDIKETSNDRH